MVSVIVPVFNVANYLERCIDSILNQSYSDLELILVNDGSTDGSYEICKKYEAKDSRVKLISQKNQGVSVARNVGLEIATGDWISFVDSDDYLDLDFYDVLMNASKNVDSEVLCCGVRPINEKGIEVSHLLTKKIPVENVKLSMRSVYQHFFDLSKRFIYWGPFDKIYRADIAKSIRFEPGRKRAEDFFYCFCAFQKCTSVYYIPQKKYNYFQRQNSVTHVKIFDDSGFDPVCLSRKALNNLIATNASQETIDVSKLLLVMLSAKAVKAFYKFGDFKNEKFRTRILELRKSLRKDIFLVRKMSIRFAVLCFLAAYFPQFFFMKR